MTDLEYAKEKASLLANILAAQLAAGSLATALRHDGYSNAVTRHAHNALYYLTRANESAIRLPASVLDQTTPGHPECLHKHTVTTADGKIVCVHCDAIVARTH